MEENEKEVVKEQDIEKEEEIATEPKNVPDDDSKVTLLEVNKEEMCAKIEETRLNFFNLYKRQKRINLIVMLVFLAVIVLFMVLFGTDPSKFSYALVAIVIYFAFMWIYSKKMRTILNEAVDKYISTYSRLVDSYVFNQENVSDVEIFFHRKVELDQVKRARVVKDINHVGSRDLIEGKMFDISFVASDLLINTLVAGEKKPKPVFIGKYFEFDDINLTKEGRTLIYLQGNEQSVGPSDINDLEKVNIDGLKDKFKVYSSEKEPQKILNLEMINALNAFEPNDDLIDLFISFNEDKAYIGLSYSDELMVIPLMKEFNVGPTEQYHGDMIKLLTLVKSFKNK